MLKNDHYTHKDGRLGNPIHLSGTRYTVYQYPSCCMYIDHFRRYKDCPMNLLGHSYTLVQKKMKLASVIYLYFKYVLTIHEEMKSLTWFSS